MIDFKKIIAEAISKVLEMDALEIEKTIEKPKGPDNGDYAFPCFRLAKTLRKAPPMIADDIKAKIKANQDEITKIEVVLLSAYSISASANAVSQSVHQYTGFNPL